MLYENTLLQSFQKGQQDLLIKQEVLRKEIANMIYCFYTNNKSGINYYMKKYMLDSGVHETKVWDSVRKRLDTLDEGNYQMGMFTEKTVKIMPKIHIDIVNKIVDMVCTVYNSGADRYLLDKDGEVDEAQTEILMDIYNGFDATKKILECYKQGYLFNTILANVIWRDDKIDLDIITPNFCSVDSDESNFEKPEAIMISKFVNDEDMIVYWSDEEHFYIDSDYEKIAVEDDEDNVNSLMINPYKEIPFAVLRFQSSSDFWGEPQQDLAENNIWYNVMESNRLFVEMFQGLGIGVGINLGKNATVTNAPNTMIMVNDVRDDMERPSIEFASTNAPLGELRENLDFYYKRIGNSKGLSPQSMSNDITGQSGVAKAYDSIELTIKKDNHKHIMKQFEKELFQKIKLVYNFHSDKKLSDDLMFNVDIIEDEPETDVSKEIELNNFKLEKNIISVIDLMIKDNPDLTTEEAIQRIQDNKKLNEVYINGEADNKAIETGQDGNTDSTVN